MIAALLLFAPVLLIWKLSSLLLRALRNHPENPEAEQRRDEDNGH
jgi:hypothetical protein